MSINGRPARKSSQDVPEGAKLVVIEADDYVSRAGHKLAMALDEFETLEKSNAELWYDNGAEQGIYSFGRFLKKAKISRMPI